MKQDGSLTQPTLDLPAIKARYDRMLALDKEQGRPKSPSWEDFLETAKMHAQLDFWMAHPELAPPSNQEPEGYVPN